MLKRIAQCTPVLMVLAVLAGCTLAGPGNGSTPPAATPAPVAQPAPVPTFTPRATPTVPPTATAQPTVTPLPSQRLRAAENRQRAGDYDGAVAQYAEILTQPDDPAATDALFYLGETQMLSGQPVLSGETLQSFLRKYPKSHWVPQAHFFLGEMARKSGDWEEALKQYRTFDEQDDSVTPYVAERMAEVYEALGRPDSAIREYQRIVADPAVDRVWRTLTAEKIANYYFEGKEYDQALTWFDRVLAGAKIGYYRAEMMYKAGLSLEGLGRDEEAWQRFADIVVYYPATEHAAKALEELQAVQYQVNLFQQGLIQFYNGQNKLAIALFQRYLKEPEAPYAPNARYTMALAYDRQDDTDSALRALDTLLRVYPQSALAGKAQLEKGRIYAEMGNMEKALAAYRLLAVQQPEDRLAPQGLWKAAELLEQQGRASDAATAYEALVTQYPGDDGADEALDRAAMIRYRAGDTSGAGDDWQRLAAEYAGSDLRAKAIFWAGKIAEAGGSLPEARTIWAQAVQAAPESFYGRRAADRLSGRTLTVLPQPIHDVSISPGEQGALESWIQSWSPKPVTTTIPNATAGLLPDSVREQLAFRRGETLLSLGLRSEAADEFTRLLDLYRGDPWTSYALARYFQDAGMYSLEISAAERVAWQSPANSLFDVPVALQRLVYPLPFTEDLLAQANQQQVDPLLLASLVWQESRWEPSATSGAEAIGLSQVIPDTGRWIALQLRRPAFTPDDLYRPVVGLEFGAYYLARQLDSFDRDLLRALAAYNAGPGNVQRWDNPDTDLFVENIDVEETRLYLERIYAHYRAYEAAYRKG